MTEKKLNRKKPVAKPAAKKPVKAKKPAVKKTVKKVVTAKKQVTKNPVTKKKTKAGKLQIIPLGGLDKIGMNITAIRYENSIIVVDCGIAFPDEDMLGIDKVIPDVTFLVEHKDMVKGFFITHGHEDHIGALPYVLPQVNAPVFCTKLTMGLIEHKLKEAKCLDITERHVVRQGGTVKLGDFSVEFIKTNHSIPGASSLAIKTPAGLVFHTGDFKVDYTPLFGDTINLQRIAELGREGVLAVISDSTNAMKPGFTPSETKVAATLDALFSENSKNRIFVATFSSNVDRVQQIFNTAKKYNRKVVLQGRSMEDTISIARDLGCIKIPGGTLISVDEMNDYPDNKLVFITTGSQGEAMAALSRMAEGDHKKVSIKEGDVIVFSSNPIPGNEHAVAKVMNELAERGARLIYQDTHVSGHACQQELQLIYTLLNPTFALPMHGEYRHRQAAADLIKKLGIPAKNVIVMKSGEVLELSSGSAAVVDRVPCGEIFVDGLGVGDIGNAVIRDRQALATSGIVMITLTVDAAGNYVAGPEIITRGFIYVRESAELLGDMQRVVIDSLMTAEERRIRDLNKIKTLIKNDMDDYLWKRFKRSPIIIPVIMEASL